MENPSGIYSYPSYIIPKEHVKRYKKVCSARSLLKPTHVNNHHDRLSRTIISNPLTENNTNGFLTTSKNGHLEENKFISGNVFSRGILSVRSDRPFTPPQVLLNIKTTNPSLNNNTSIISGSATAPNRLFQANMTSTTAKPNPSCRYERLDINSVYMNKTSQMSQHVVNFLKQLNAGIVRNAMLRQKIQLHANALQPINSHQHAHKHLGHPSMDNVQNELCKLFASLQKTLADRNIASNLKNEFRLKKIDCSLVELSSTALRLLNNDTEALIDNIFCDTPDFRLFNFDTAAQRAYECNEGLSYIAPGATIIGNRNSQTTIVKPEMMEQAWKIQENTLRIKHELADELSLNFRIRQFMAEHKKNQIPSNVHFHSSTLSVPKLYQQEQCYLCILCTTYNDFLYYTTYSNKSLYSFMQSANSPYRNREVEIFSLTSMLLYLIKHDTQALLADRQFHQLNVDITVNACVPILLEKPPFAFPKSMTLNCSQPASSICFDNLFPTDPEQMEKIWLIEQHIFLVKKEMHKEILRNHRLRRLLQLNATKPDRDNLHFHTTLRSSSASTPLPDCHICTLGHLYNVFLASIEITATQRFSFYKKITATNRNRNLEIYSLLSISLYRLKEDTTAIYEAIQAFTKRK